MDRVDLKAVARYVVIIILTSSLWLAVLMGRDALLKPCELSCVTFMDYVAHDPYCMVDPVCVSPLHSQHRNILNKGRVSQWDGVIQDGNAGMYGTGLHALAIPNYIIFLDRRRYSNCPSGRLGATTKDRSTSNDSSLYLVSP